MEDGGRQHRLSHRSGAALLQRAVRAGAPRGGRAPNGGDSGSSPPRRAGSVACPLLRAGESHYADRAHAQVAPEVPGAHALAADRRCPADRTLHRSTGGSDPGGQAPSGDGIPFLPGDSAIGEKLSRRAHGSGGPALPAGARIQLPEHGPAIRPFRLRWNTTTSAAPITSIPRRRPILR